MKLFQINTTKKDKKKLVFNLLRPELKFILYHLSIGKSVLQCCGERIKVPPVYQAQKLKDQDEKIAQSTGAVEYTDCTFAEGYTPPPMSVLDMSLNNLMVRFQ